MQQKQFGSNGPNVSVIGQGTWYIDRGDRKQAVAALQRGIEAGMTHIDTAEMYGDAELVIADAIAGSAMAVPGLESAAEQRLAPRHHHCLRAFAGAAEDRSSRLLSAALARILSASGHVAAFEELIAAGKIRSWGVSNFDVDDLDHLHAVAGKGKIACNQVLYHLQERAIEHAVIPWCEQHGVAVVAYSPFGHNEFPSARSKGGEVLQTIAQAHKASAASGRAELSHARAVGVCDSKGLVGGARRRECRGGKSPARRSEIAALDKAFPRGPKPRGLPML